MKFQKHEPKAAAFQLAPMIDIVFLLLIFFIVTWNISNFEREREINLPNSDEGTPRNANHLTITINIFEDGSIKVDQKTFTVEQLAARMGNVARLNPEHPVLIYGDKQVTLEQAFEVYNICRKAGLKLVNIAAESTKK